MTKFCIRFNKSRGEEGRGTMDHVWRVFEGDVEHLAKDVLIQVPSWTEKTGEDWSVCCRGKMSKINDVDVIIIRSE